MGMADPNITIASTGAALVTIATVAIGPILGEYSIIIFLGLLGTLIALTEQSFTEMKDKVIFVVKGIVFSIIFAGIATNVIIGYLPEDTGLTPYAILGAVSFTIGWTSNKWEKIRDHFLAMIGKKNSKD